MTQSSSDTHTIKDRVMESKQSGQERTFSVSLFFATQQNITMTKHKQGKTIPKNQEIGLDQQQA